MKKVKEFHYSKKGELAKKNSNNYNHIPFVAPPHMKRRENTEAIADLCGQPIDHLDQAETRVINHISEKRATLRRVINVATGKKANSPKTVPRDLTTMGLMTLVLLHKNGLDN